MGTEIHALEHTKGYKELLFLLDDTKGTLRCLIYDPIERNTGPTEGRQRMSVTERNNSLHRNLIVFHNFLFPNPR